MRPFDDVARVVGVRRVELAAWVEARWVLPRRESGRIVFDEADIERVRLIRDLRRDLSIGRDAIPVVLSLLDQLYSARRRLRDLREAIDELPEPARAALGDRLAARTRERRQD